MGEAVNVVPVQIDPRNPASWEAVEPYLQEAIEQADGHLSWNAEGMRDAAIHNRERFALWVLQTMQEPVGAMFTCFTSYPNRTVLEVVALAARSNVITNWGLLTDVVKTYARFHGASAVVGRGRPAWAKFLKATRSTTLWEYDLGD